jgi:cell division protein FtsQ
VVAAAGLGGAPPLIDVDPGAAAAAVEQLPWIAHATVTPQWPDSVVVTVTERVPSIVVAGPGGRWTEVDRSGRVLAELPPGPAPAGLVHLSVPLAPGAVGSSLGGFDQSGVAVAGSLPPAFAGQVASVSVDAGGSLHLALTTSVTVDLGNDSQLTAKYEDVASLLAHATLHAGDVLDVSVPGSPTVTGP